LSFSAAAAPQRRFLAGRRASDLTEKLPLASEKEDEAAEERLL
jgi:hypothetical protein